MQRFENKFDLLKAAYKDSTLKKGTILLMQYLVHKSNKEQCFPAVKTIAKALNVCERTVQYNMRKLEHAGYIIRKDRYYNHQQLSNQYIFNLGVTEDMSQKEKYEEREKEQINCMFGVENGSEDINKAMEILNVYEMQLSSREKLLLVYLIHRANTKGLVYDTSITFMNAIGVGSRMFVKLLGKLRNKNLICVKTIKVSGKKLLVIKLTRVVWKPESTSSSCNAIRNIKENCTKKTSIGMIPKMKLTCKNKLHIAMKDKWKRRRSKKKFRKNFFKNIWNKCKGTIQFGLHKIREILRL